MQRESRGLAIRSRLILAGVAPAAAALLIACSAFLASELYFFPREVGVSLGRLAEMIGDNSSAALVFDDRSVTDRLLENLDSHSAIEAAAIYDISGEVVSKYHRSGDVGAFDPPPARETGLFSRAEAGKLTLEQIDFDPSACAEQALELLSAKADENRIELALLVAADVPKLVSGVSKRLARS